MLNLDFLLNRHFFSSDSGNHVALPWNGNLGEMWGNEAVMSKTWLIVELGTSGWVHNAQWECHVAIMYLIFSLSDMW